MPFHQTLLVALVFALASAVANAAETYRNPVIKDNLADPVHLVMNDMICSPFFR